jgi:HSP20 family molecular chaperone IbpA
MSLFRTSFPDSGDFSPLFRLLDDYHDHRSQPAARSFSPRFDVHETNEAYHLDGELPGVAQKDVNIEFSDHQTLVVKGRIEHEYRTPEPQESAKNSEKTDAKPARRFWASERSIGEFQRSFTFPTRVNQDNVKASLKDGILSIAVPKATAAATKKITIE